MKSLALICLLILSAVACPAKEESLGAWHDRAGTAFDRVIEIVRLDGAVVQRSTFKNGEVVNRPLVEKVPQEKERRVFIIVGSGHGDGCAIRKDGALDIFDAEGLIRIAPQSQR